MGIINKKAFDMLFRRKENKDNKNNKGPSKMSYKLMNPHFDDMISNRNEYMELMSNKEYELLEVTSKFGYKLKARLYKSNKYNGITIICVHGYHSNGIRDYAHIAFEYLKNNYNVLLIDNCGHGESEGEFITFGVNESKDAINWVNKINELYPTSKIVIQGCSLGGATVLNMSNMDLKNVICIISDSAFSSSKDEFNWLAKSFTGLKFKLIINSIEKYAYKKANFDFTTISPINCVKNSKYPILFIHGKEDHFVSCSCLDKLYNACSSKKQKITYEDAGHCGSHLKQGYFDNIYKFINENI